jgi:hypothetical protein
MRLGELRPLFDQAVNHLGLVLVSARILGEEAQQNTHACPQNGFLQHVCFLVLSQEVLG